MSLVLSFTLFSIVFSQDSLDYSQVVALTGENYAEFIENDIKIVEFYSKDCDSLPELETKLEQIMMDNPQIAYGKMDVEKNRDFVAKLRYKILPDKPTVVFFMNGELANGFVGYRSASELSNIVASIKHQKKMADALAKGEIGFMEAYDFTLPSLEGKDVTLSELEGLIILDFWATWCPPCKEEIPYLQEFYEEYGDKGLKVIGISTEPAVTQRKFRSKQSENGNKIGYPLLVDSEGEVSKQYGIRSIPTTYFISSDGELIKKEVGFTQEFAEEYRQIIENNLPQ